MGWSVHKIADVESALSSHRLVHHLFMNTTVVVVLFDLLSLHVALRARQQITYCKGVVFKVRAIGRYESNPIIRFRPD